MADNTDWSKIYEDGGDFRVLTPHELTNILQHTLGERSPGNALDIGCGTGQLTRDLWFRGFSVKGIDPSSKAIEIAKSASAAVSDSSLSYAVSDTSGLRETEQYDLIFCKLVYAFIEDKEAFLNDVKMHLQPHGAFILLTPVLGSKISETKPFICVDYKLTLRQLSDTFGNVSVHSLGNIECFIAYDR